KKEAEARAKELETRLKQKDTGKPDLSQAATLAPMTEAEEQARIAELEPPPPPALLMPAQSAEALPPSELAAPAPPTAPPPSAPPLSSSEPPVPAGAPATPPPASPAAVPPPPADLLAEVEQIEESESTRLGTSWQESKTRIVAAAAGLVIVIGLS